MAIVKSFFVGDGDMFYIKHGSKNFSIIDCYMDENSQETITSEILKMRKGKEVTRFISTHPDEDHIGGLKYLDGQIGIVNFYCVNNAATKKDASEDFKYYCQLRDSEYHYYVSKGCKRKWMNDNDKNDGKDYGSSGINFLWPVTSNKEFMSALYDAKNGTSYNNLSPVFTYTINQGVKMMWMGDMEHDFLEKVKDEISWPEIDILFAPHHGRQSGKVSSDVLEKLNANIIIIGEAPSKYLNYYQGYNTITQNSAGDIVFDCDEDYVHIYIGNNIYNYDISFLEDRKAENSEYGYYLGSFKPKGA